MPWHNSYGRSSQVPGEHPLIEPSEILNTAVFAPMPGANMSTATAVKPEFFNSWRTA